MRCAMCGWGWGAVPLVGGGGAQCHLWVGGGDGTQLTLSFIDRVALSKD